MLEHLGERESALAIEQAVMKTIQKHIKSMSAGQMGLSTSEVGDKVAGSI